MLKKRIIVGLLSTLIFSIVMAYVSYTPIADQEANSWYESFGSLFQVYLIFSLPAYLLGGIPISLFIDKRVKKEMIKFPLYLCGGFLVGMATIGITFMVISFELVWYGLVGSCASLLYYVLMLLTKRWEKDSAVFD